ncbi:hypothetical protein FXO37_19989 [Capsicum annuum]|nr:hypothetical protein FXO37_19989 [Capsicum annuum]
MEESGAFFDNRPNFMVGEDHINEENLFTSFSTSSPYTTIPHFTTADSATAYSASAPTAAPSVPTSTAAPSIATSTAALPSATAASVASPSVVAGSVAAVNDIDVGPAGSDFSEKVEDSDYSTEDGVESERELVGDDDDEKYGSDVHEEVRELRDEKRKFQRRKRKERVPADNAEKTPTEATNAAPQGKKDGSGRGRGRPKKTPPEAPNAAPQGKSNGSSRGRGRPKLGMPSSKIYSTGQAKVARSADVTGDIGYTPSSTGKLKWNDKSTISTRKLQELKENRRKKKVGSSSNHPSQNTASSQSNMPWKL